LLQAFPERKRIYRFGPSAAGYALHAADVYRSEVDGARLVYGSYSRSPSVI
jgi:hypothetical protein